MSGYRPEGLDDTFSTGASEVPVAPTTTTSDAARGIGVVGWLRWGWRQLTSMRVALLLLVLLAVAAVPGSVFPQRGQDAAAVARYIEDHGAAGELLDRLGLFDAYTSAWFSAIYLLLFVSLVGCILPRSRQHWTALRARPPRTPRRFARFPAQGEGSSSDEPRAVAERAAAVLRRRRLGLPGYRVDVHDEGAGVWSASAERGYLRESGNLVFHLALVGLLVAVATGQLLHYRAQVLVVQGEGFANAQASFDSFEHGRAFDPGDLVPFTVRLDEFESRFDPVTLQSRDFTAHVTVTEPGGAPAAATIKVNHPLHAGGAKLYLQGNGYAPVVTVRDGAGEVAFSGPVPFLPEDQVYTSRGVVKVPDVSGGQAQVGLVGYLLPTARQGGPEQWFSVDPQPEDPLLVLAVWSGDLGLDEGVPQNVYTLDESGLTQAMDGDGPVTRYVRPGETVTLPDGLGELTFDGLRRYVALDLRRDPAVGWVLAFALLALAGLAASLFVPRRRIWVRATPGEGDQSPTTVVTAAGLARGDDVGLAPEVERVLAAVLGGSGPDGADPVGRAAAQDAGG